MFEQLLQFTQRLSWELHLASAMSRYVTFVFPIGTVYTLEWAAKQAGISHVSSHTFRHMHRTWLDSVGTPVGVQQKLMRHASITTTMNF